MGSASSKCPPRPRIGDVCAVSAGISIPCQRTTLPIEGANCCKIRNRSVNRGWWGPRRVASGQNRWRMWIEPGVAGVGRITGKITLYLSLSLLEFVLIRYADRRLCNRLRSQIFDACHKKVNPTMYYKACLQDMCECPTENCYCESFTAYVHECKRLGIQLPHWRKSTRCRTGWDQFSGSGASLGLRFP